MTENTDLKKIIEDHYRLLDLAIIFLTLCVLLYFIVVIYSLINVHCSDTITFFCANR